MNYLSGFSFQIHTTSWPSLLEIYGSTNSSLEHFEFVLIFDNVFLEFLLHTYVMIILGLIPFGWSRCTFCDCDQVIADRVFELVSKYRLCNLSKNILERAIRSYKKFRSLSSKIPSFRSRVNNFKNAKIKIWKLKEKEKFRGGS